MSNNTSNDNKAVPANDKSNWASESVSALGDVAKDLPKAQKLIGTVIFMFALIACLSGAATVLNPTTGAAEKKEVLMLFIALVSVLLLLAYAMPAYSKLMESRLKKKLQETSGALEKAKDELGKFRSQLSDSSEKYLNLLSGIESKVRDHKNEIQKEINNLPAYGSGNIQKILATLEELEALIREEKMGVNILCRDIDECDQMTKTSKKAARDISARRKARLGGTKDSFEDV